MILNFKNKPCVIISKHYRGTSEIYYRAIFDNREILLLKNNFGKGALKESVMYSCLDLKNKCCRFIEVKEMYRNTETDEIFLVKKQKGRLKKLSSFRFVVKILPKDTKSLKLERLDQ